MLPYTDRRQAGRHLAEALPADVRDADPVVLALVRGGMPVAAEIAAALDAPLDVFLVRKLGVPGHEELAAGAIASGDVRVVNDRVTEATGVTAEQLDARAEEERREMERREHLYRGDREPVPVAGRTAILVDDGIATGASMEAAIRALRQREPARVVVAVPVAPTEVRKHMERVADLFVCPETPTDFMAVGANYQEFPQVDDAEVGEILARVRGEG
jgi:predicted phosphoribosyltransferase